MAHPKPSDNVVSFPAVDERSDASARDTGAGADTHAGGTADISPDFGPLGADWPALSHAERAQRLFQNRQSSDKPAPIGRLFEAVRQAQSLSIDDVAAKLKFDRSVIAAIETMALGAMPNGFRAPRIKTYARALHLPADDVLAIYREESADLDAAAPRPSRPAPIETTKTPAIVALGDLPTGWTVPAAVASAVVVGLLGASLLSGSDEAESRVGPINAFEAPRTELPPFDSAAAAMEGDYTALPLTLVAVRNGWVEVRGANGTLFRDREMKNGEVYYPRIGAGWTVSARDGGAFEWRVGDVVVNRLGEDDTSVYAESVDLVARQALKSVAPTLAASEAVSPRH